MPTDPTFVIPESAISERFLAASGPGGQNVNKVATACQLRVNIFALGLAPDVYARLKTIAGSRINNLGEIVITARRFRTQEGNRADARTRVQKLLDQALVRPERRIATRPGKAAKARRVDSKKARSSVKAHRAPVRDEQ